MDDDEAGEEDAQVVEVVKSRSRGGAILYRWLQRLGWDRVGTTNPKGCHTELFASMYVRAGL